MSNLNKDRIEGKRRAIRSELSHSNAADKIRQFVRVFAPGYTLDYTKSIPSMAAMDHASKRILINLDIVAVEIIRILDKRYDSQHQRNSQFGYVVGLLIRGLLIHELGHVYYTPENEVYEQYRNKHNLTCPEDLMHYVANVVEDSYIQRKFIQDYPVKSFEQSLRLVMDHVQRDHDLWSKFNSPALDLQGNLFYLIFLAYNPEKVHAKKPKGIFLDDALIEQFKTIFYVDTQSKRLALTVQFAQDLYEFLKKNRPDQFEQKQGSLGEGEPQDGESQGNDSGTGDSEGSDQESEGQGSSESGEDSSEDTEGGENETAGQETGSDQEGDDKSDSNTRSPGKGIGDGSEEDGYTDEEIDDAVQEALKRTNITESVHEEDEEIRKPTMQDYKLEKVAIDVVTKTTRYSKLKEKIAQEIAYKYVMHLKRVLADMYTDPDYNRKSGYVDKHVVHKSWHSPKIFYKDEGLKRETDLFVMNQVDISGSTENPVPNVGDNETIRFGEVYLYLGAGLVFAMQQLDLESSLYAFSHRNAIVIDHRHPQSFDRMLGRCAQAYQRIGGGGTSPLHGVEHAQRMFETVTNQDRAYIIYTDGLMHDYSKVQKILTDMEERGITIIAVGLGLESSEYDMLRNLTPHVHACNYVTYQDIMDKLPYDVEQILIQNYFIK